jgi:hypothetical protein
MAHSNGIPALSGTGFEIQEIPDHMLRFFDLLLETRLAEREFASIVLCDYLTTDYTLALYGVDAERLLRYDLPVILLDTWEYDVTGSTIDTFGFNRWHTATWIQNVKRRLVPTPIGRLKTTGAYCGLSPYVALPRSVRRHIRQNLGLTDSERAVLFCTADWQHNIKDPDGARLADALPKLLWSYLSSIDVAVRLIHVGPAPLPLSCAGERYLWMPSVTSDTFDRLLGSADLLLSANISATTIGRAIASGVPVVVIQNSCNAKTAADAESAVGSQISETLRAWLEVAAPLYPFSLWPLGHWRFLKPLLGQNPYCKAVDVIELLDENGFVETCRRLLFDSAVREDASAREIAYAAQVRQLPTAAQLIDGYLQ